MQRNFGGSLNPLEITYFLDVVAYTSVEFDFEIVNTHVNWLYLAHYCTEITMRQDTRTDRCEG